MATMLKRIGETTQDVNGKPTKVGTYQKAIVTYVTVTKEFLLRQKEDLEKQLAQINLDLSQIENDEALGEVVVP